MSTAPTPTLPTDHITHPGPFDVIGDVHGCLAELTTLLTRLGYEASEDGWHSPTNRTAVFVGDLVDRGPDNMGVLRLVMAMVRQQRALCVPGNHDLQLARHLGGEPVAHVHGLRGTVEEFVFETVEFRLDVLHFYRSLPSHVVLDHGRLVVAHTGLAEEHHGRESAMIRHLAAYGVAHGEIERTDVWKRHAWLAGYQGAAVVVYGHTPAEGAWWKGNTINIDTGCVFGRSLTALQWPSREIVSVASSTTAGKPGRSFLTRSDLALDDAS